MGSSTYVAPDFVASVFGMPADSDGARFYLRGLGARNVVLGALLATFLARGERSALRATIGITALAGVSDVALVALARGSAVRVNLALHAGGVAGLVALFAAYGEPS